MDVQSRLDVLVEYADAHPEVFDDPQVVNNQAIPEYEHPDAGPVKVAKPPIRWGAAAPEIKTGADHLGQSTDEVLSAAGYSEHAITELRAAGVILDI